MAGMWTRCATAYRSELYRSYWRKSWRRYPEDDDDERKSAMSERMRPLTLLNYFDEAIQKMSDYDDGDYDDDDAS